jgi:flagellar biosynthesis/type III secretory pathway chaperone
LSTLTKVLIVLLTVFSIFLCGIVVTYVGNANDYRKEATRLKRDIQVAREDSRSALEEAEKVKQNATAKETDLGKQIEELTAAKEQLVAQIDTLKRENGQLVQEVTNMGAAVKLANETMAKLRDQAAAAEQEVAALQADQTDRNKELQETTQALMEKMAVISDLEKKNRQLIEERQGIQSQLSQRLAPYGMAPVRPQPVTASPQTGATPVQRPIAQPPQAAGTMAREIKLNGRVTQVDVKNKVAAISIGSAAGVKEDMKFHVTRGDRFICDILIFDVDSDKAIGTLDLVQAEPQAGDMAATNL